MCPARIRVFYTVILVTLPRIVNRIASAEVKIVKYRGSNRNYWRFEGR